MSMALRLIAIPVTQSRASQALALSVTVCGLRASVNDPATDTILV